MARRGVLGMLVGGRCCGFARRVRVIWRSDSLGDQRSIRRRAKRLLKRVRESGRSRYERCDMCIQMSQAIVIIFVWVFCLLQDKWFDKILIYQIRGQAEKYKSSSIKAINLYNKTNHKNIWIILALSLTIIIISTNIIDIFINVFLIIISLFFFIFYFFIKLSTYNKSSVLINKRI